MVECPHHGELREKMKQAEEKIEDIECKQQDLRKPEDGALAKMHEKMNNIADAMMKKSEFRWIIGSLCSLSLIIATASFSYTGKVETKTDMLKERVDREVVTRQDLECLRKDMNEFIKEIREERKKHLEAKTGISRDYAKQ